MSMKETTYIHWEQAVKHFKHNQKEDVEKCRRIIEEIESSDFTCLNANDINYFANELNRYSNRVDERGKRKLYTPNEVRRMNIEANELESFYLLNTFIDDITDDIIDFY